MDIVQHATTLNTTFVQLSSHVSLVFAKWPGKLKLRGFYGSFQAWQLKNLIGIGHNLKDGRLSLLWPIHPWIRFFFLTTKFIKSISTRSRSCSETSDFSLVMYAGVLQSACRLKPRPLLTIQCKLEFGSASIQSKTDGQNPASHFFQIIHFTLMYNTKEMKT